MVFKEKHQELCAYVLIIQPMCCSVLAIPGSPHFRALVNCEKLEAFQDRTKSNWLIDLIPMVY